LCLSGYAVRDCLYGYVWRVGMGNGPYAGTYYWAGTHTKVLGW